MMSARRCAWQSGCSCCSRAKPCKGPRTRSNAAPIHRSRIFSTRYWVSTHPPLWKREPGGFDEMVLPYKSRSIPLFQRESPMTFVHDLGWAVVRFIDDLGRLALFTLNVGRAMFTPPVRGRPFLDELFKLGVLSLIIICVC